MRTTVIVLELCMAALVVSAARGDDSVRPEARQLIDEVSSAYRGLTTYEDHGVLTLTARIQSRTQTLNRPLAFRVERPDRLSIDAGGVRLVSDGKTALTVLAATKRFYTEPAPGRMSPGLISEGPIGSMLLGGPGGRVASVLLNLLTADDPATAILEDTKSARRGENATLDGHEVRVLVLTPSSGPEIHLLIDPQTHLVQRVELATDAATAILPPEIAPSDLGIYWVPGELKTDAIDPGAFAVTPPAGFTEVSPLQAAKDEPASPPGKP